ncbi:MAG: hypothetical protein ACNYVW_07895, partial [Methanosarcinales archaeon]
IKKGDPVKMNWVFIKINAFEGWKEPLLCSVCGKTIDKTWYYPEDLTDEEAKWIEEIWDCEPVTEFVVCEDCVTGYEKAIKGADPGKWLNDKIIDFKEQHEEDGKSKPC